MKALFIFCAICCFIAILDLPIGYYTFLRVSVFLGAVLAIYNCLKEKDRQLATAFIVILFLFNPVFPIYLYKRTIWFPIDLAVGLLFLWMVFGKKKRHQHKAQEQQVEQKVYIRDRIIVSKKAN